MEARNLITVGMVLAMSSGIDMRSVSCPSTSTPCGSVCCEAGQTCDKSGVIPICQYCYPGCSFDQHCCRNGDRSQCCESYEVCTDGYCIREKASNVTDPDLKNVDKSDDDTFPSFDYTNYKNIEDNYNNNNNYNFNPDINQNNNDGESSSSGFSSGHYVVAGGGAGGGGFIIICCICVRRRRRVVRLTGTGNRTVVTRSANVTRSALVAARTLAAARASNTGPTRAAANANQMPMGGRGNLLIITCNTTGARPVDSLEAPGPAGAAQAGQPGGAVVAPPAYEAVVGDCQPGRPDDPPPYSEFRAVSDKEKLCEETE